MKTLSLLVLLPTLAFAELTTSSISSESASYDGSALVLRGKVELDHALGKIESTTARLTSKDLDDSLSAIHLQDNVKIRLKNRGKLECHVADFDFECMKGTLNSEDTGLVTLTDFSLGLKLACQGAKVALTSVYDELKISKIQADNPIEVVYGNDFFLKADGAIYTDEKTPMIQASPNCILTHFDDSVKAQQVLLYPASSKVVMKQPSGWLRPTIFSKAAEVFFTCDKLIWDHTPHQLTLQGHAHIEDKVIGTIESEDEIELRQQLRDEKWIVTDIVSRGETSLTYCGDGSNEHRLDSYGGMIFDGDRFVLTACKSSEHPVHYQFNEILLQSDEAELKYSPEGEHFTAESLVLSGNIRLSSSSENHRCAIADHVSFHSKSQQIILKAKEGERVLFWDEEQHLSISAKEVHICQEDKGEKVKGIGNVRFAFTSTESALLKKLFPFYQPKGDSS